MNTHEEMALTPEELESAKRTRAYSSLAHLELETEHRTFSPKRMFPQLVLGVFFIALLLALTTGALVYKSMTDSAAQSSSSRQGAALVCNAVHANDVQGAIAMGSGPEGRSLVIVEELQSGTFETRFYLFQGRVLQEYSIAGTPYTPEKASVVADSDTFEFTYSKGLLSVTTDQGTSNVALRSAQGGA